MYIIGHIHTVLESGLLHENEVEKSHLVDLMMPDFINCHDWLYRRGWELKGSLTEQLFIAHLIGDWIVHFGPNRHVERRKVGWAYKRMKTAVGFYDSFFEKSRKLGFRSAEPPCDSIRGFSHTMTEYCLDSFICSTSDHSSLFKKLKEGYSKITITYVNKVIDELDISYDFQNSPALLHKEIESYQLRVELSETPSDLAYYAAVRKFGLRICRDSLEFVREYQDQLLRTLSHDEMRYVLDSVAQAIGNPSILPEKEKILAWDH